MTYAYDDYVQMPTKDLYDTAVMKMAIEAAKDMYDKGQAQMENFYKTYGDFMSPFAKDMELYGKAMNNVRQTVNDAYARGIDLFKSPEGRSIVAQLSHSIDPLWYNSARQNAKVGYAYLDAAAKLRAAGKYSEAQELFDIVQNKGTQFGNFSTIDPQTGRIRMWDRPSPVEATSLLGLTYDFYKNRTPRDLTAGDFEGTGYTYDPKYQYTGYMNSDLLSAAPGVANALVADPRFEFYKEQARQQALAINPNATQADIDAQLYRNIANANQWALVNPTKKADAYATLDYQHELNERSKQADFDRAKELANIKGRYAESVARIRQGGKTGNGLADVFQYGEATKDAAIIKMVQSAYPNGMIPKLDERGNYVRENGKVKMISIADASAEEVYSAYNDHRNVNEYNKFLRKLANKYKGTTVEGDRTTGLFGTKAFEEYLDKFGYEDTATGWEASMGKKIGSNGQVIYSPGDFNQLYTDGELMNMMSDRTGYHIKNNDHTQNVMYHLDLDSNSTQLGILNGTITTGQYGGFVEPISGKKNKVFIINKDGSMQLFRAVNISYGNKNNRWNTGRMWVPVGAPTMPSADGKHLNPYRDETGAMSEIEENALYSKATGSQKNQNISLTAGMTGDPIIDSLLNEE